jgi:peroxiredoxin
MPSLQRLQQRFSFEDVRVVAVTTDLQRTGIRQFLERVGATFPALFDEDQVVSQSYMVRGLPTTVLIGRDGKIVGRAVGPRDWDSPEAVSFIKSLAGP